MESILFHACSFFVPVILLSVYVLLWFCCKLFTVADSILIYFVANHNFFFLIVFMGGWNEMTEAMDILASDIAIESCGGFFVRMSAFCYVGCWLQFLLLIITFVYFRQWKFHSITKASWNNYRQKSTKYQLRTKGQRQNNPWSWKIRRQFEIDGWLALLFNQYNSTSNRSRSRPSSQNDNMKNEMLQRNPIKIENKWNLPFHPAIQDKL